ncbi:YopX family protein [Neobacillus vireti]|uniref:YopX family protein n=1 Tax=Neobacillus vireti TaxID=220686 RepID=UPI002FFF46BB
MRVIKFRACDQENNTMIEWHDTFFYDTSEVTRWSGDFSYIEMPLMQYTGLNDSKGKEIYEGDIIRDTEGDLWEVYFEDGSFVAKGGQYNLREYLIEFCPLHCEVFGNIYENPDWNI